MHRRFSRAFSLVGCFVTLSLGGAAAAQTDGGAPAGPPPSGGPDGGSDGASSPAGAPVEEGGGGLFEQSVAASSGAAAVPGAAPTLPFTLNGYVRGDFFVGKVPGEQAAEMKAAYGELSMGLRTAKTTYGDGFAELRVRHGLQGSERTTFLNLREAYVNTYLGRLDLRFGQQIIVWGRADALNPTNNLTPVDFRIRSPLEDDIRVGNIGARGSLRFSPFRLEGVWMPVYLPNELPSFGLPDPVVFGAPTFPRPDLRNGTGAGRLHLELPAVEISVSYLNGYALMPGVTLAGLQFDPVNPSVQVSRAAYRHQVVGFDFSTAIGDIMTVRGEAAYRLPFDYENNPHVARPDVQGVLGLDHNFGSFSVIGQGMVRYVFDWQRAAGTNMSVSDLRGILMNMDPADWTEPVTEAIQAELAQTSQILFSQTARLQPIATLRFEWLLAHETLSISALSLYNFTTQEWLVMPRIGYRLSDAVMAYVGGQVFQGPDDTLFGFIDQDLSAGYTELRFLF